MNKISFKIIAESRYLIASLFILFVMMSWFSSGTLTPYALTQYNPLLLHCGYLVNTDHDHFVAASRFVAGLGPEYWGFSLVLRRVLYPLLALPVMKVFGFIHGGFLFNILLHTLGLLVALLSLNAYFSKQQKLEAAKRSTFLCLIIFIFNPGMYYWIGLPYCYAFIVPGMFFCGAILLSLTQKRSLLFQSIAAFSLGVLYIGYDSLLIFYFLPFLWMASQGKHRIFRVFLFSVLQVIPLFLNAYLLERYFSVPPLNSNSMIYGNIIKAYLSLSKGGWSEWFTFLYSTPQRFFQAYFGSGMWFLPAGCLVVFFINAIDCIRRKINKAERYPESSIQKLLTQNPELLLVLNGFLFWCFMEFSPPHPEEMRAHHFARFFQPLYFAMTIFLVKTSSFSYLNRNWAKTLSMLPVLVCVGNFILISGQWWGSPLTSLVYYQFYRHGVAQALSDNFRKYGFRPLGFCLRQDGTIHFFK